MLVVKIWHFTAITQVQSLVREARIPHAVWHGQKVEKKKKRVEKFPAPTKVKNSRAKAEDARDSWSIPGWGRSPGGGNGNPLQYSCLEDPMDKRSLVGYSPQGCKESDTTERLLNFPCGYFYAVCC